MKKTVGAALLGLVTACATSPEPARAPVAQSAARAEPRSAPTLGDLRRVGTVHFAASCDASVRDDFVRGVALLHSFFYEEARRVFESVAERDAGCAIAHWGAAMTWYHPIWTPPSDAEMAAGRAAIARAKAAGAKTERERDYIAALDVFFATELPATAAGVGQSCHGPGGGHTPRALAYTKAMAALHAAHPDDDEASAFYALALLGSAPVEDRTLANQLAAAAILEELWKTHRDHPGVAHYLIHAYDYPLLAPRALVAARAYASIAPWVPHALHMPSHIFTRLGLWQEGIDSNEASAQAARAYEAKYHPGAASFEELHALDYLAYAYLQTAQDTKAKAIVDHVLAMTKTHPDVDFVIAYAMAAIPARYALERKAWTEAAALSLPQSSSEQWARFPFDVSQIELAHGIGRVRTGDVAGARKALERMQQIEEQIRDERFAYFKKQVALQRAEVSALIAQHDGDVEAALRMLRETADAEDALGKHPVSPGSIVPARELLADVLLDAKRPADALAAYEASLAIYPARFAALYGAARAAELAGKADVARRRYAELLALTKDGDGQRPELRAARAFLGR